MFFKQKSDVLFREYETFGYITDNRNFGYSQPNINEDTIGDKIVSKSGAIFLSVLGRKPQSLEDLTKKIISFFPNIDIETLLTDVKEFYYMLEKDGFIISGESVQECDEKDLKFSYKFLEPIKDRALIRNALRPKKSTQDFFEEHFKGKPQLTNLHMEITSRCNERCLHCYIPHENKRNDIDSDLFYDILNQCKEMRLLHLTLSGGEPLLHKDICNFLKKCKEYDFSVNILSNLTLLNENILKEMVSNPLLGVQVSLYSMDSKIHDEITQMEGSFKKTKNSIMKLIENNIPLQISCPIMKQNKHCYDDVKNWARDNNINVGDDYVIIARYDHNIQNLNTRLSIAEINEMMIKMIKEDPQYLRRIEEEAEKKQKNTENDFVCSVCHSSICINENGSIYPCAGWQDCTIGNINKSSLHEIWENSEKVQYLRGLRNKDFNQCMQCEDKNYCTMCMVRNANEHIMGNPLVVNKYFCNIAKIKKQMVLDIKKINSDT